MVRERLGCTERKLFGTRDEGRKGPGGNGGVIKSITLTLIRIGGLFPQGRRLVSGWEVRGDGTGFFRTNSGCVLRRCEREINGLFQVCGSGPSIPEDVRSSLVGMSE